MSRRRLLNTSRSGRHINFPVMNIVNLHTLMLFFASSFAPGLAVSAPLYKCNVNGSIHYQQSACPTAGTPKRPTLESLNAERKQKLADEKAQAALRPAPSPSPGTAAIADPGRGPTNAHPAAAPTSAFKCDGRKYCSQMSSCAEAKFFLANCPGTKMDGDGDGIPCEEQFCGH
jgi:hypothetical protein